MYNSDYFQKKGREKREKKNLVKLSKSSFQKSRTRGYKTPVPVKGTGCDEMIIL